MSVPEAASIISRITDQRFDGYTDEMLAEQIDRFRNGRGSEDVHAAVEALQRVASTLAATEETLRAELGRLGIDWTGDAAQRARRLLTSHSDFSSQAEERIKQAAEIAFAYGESFNRTLHKLPDAATLRAGAGGKGVGDFLGSLIGYETDQARRVNEAAAARSQAVDALNTYAAETGEQLSRLESLRAPDHLALSHPEETPDKGKPSPVPEPSPDDMLGKAAVATDDGGKPLGTPKPTASGASTAAPDAHGPGAQAAGHGAMPRQDGPATAPPGTQALSSGEARAGAVLGPEQPCPPEETQEGQKGTAPASTTGPGTAPQGASAGQLGVAPAPGATPPAEQPSAKQPGGGGQAGGATASGGPGQQAAQQPGQLHGQQPGPQAGQGQQQPGGGPRSGPAPGQPPGQPPGLGGPEAPPRGAKEVPHAKGKLVGAAPPPAAEQAHAVGSGTQATATAEQPENAIGGAVTALGAAGAAAALSGDPDRRPRSTGENGSDRVLREYPFDDQEQALAECPLPAEDQTEHLKPDPGVLEPAAPQDASGEVENVRRQPVTGADLFADERRVLPTVVDPDTTASSDAGGEADPAEVGEHDRAGDVDPGRQ
ncbi:hypothetical protein [Haloechinothrix sp. LS1_15]|uniref:hypothetical protein n=1 Tax=Haloechinothrix sp. LS1_15 TaxID=2652248 RepID=UPI00294704A6|nr:hypothetical protein [Haloechinothrix sp. LS1_15]MDV6011184.1 PPE domain-containing protein [Haloechinothrix sp. LS1_15]